MTTKNLTIKDANATAFLRDKTLLLRALKANDDKRLLKEETTQFLEYIVTHKDRIPDNFIKPLSLTLRALVNEAVIGKKFHPQVIAVEKQINIMLSKRERQTKMVASILLILLPSFTIYCVLYHVLPETVAPVLSTVAWIASTLFLLNHYYHDLPEWFLSFPVVSSILPSDRIRTIIKETVYFCGTDLYVHHCLTLNKDCKLSFFIKSKRTFEINFFTDHEFLQFKDKHDSLLGRFQSKNDISSPECTNLTVNSILEEGMYHIVYRPPVTSLLSRSFTPDDKWAIFVCIRATPIVSKRPSVEVAGPVVIAAP